MSNAPGHRGALIAVIRGTVQGVGFRYSSQLAADRLGVTGWVRNLSDGSVEAHLEGTPEAVAAMVAWLEVGPPGSAVSGVTTREVVAEGYGRFLIRR